MDDILKAVISAVISIAVPALLKQILPEPEKVDELPVLKWIVAGFVGGTIGGIVSGSMGLVLEGYGNWAAYGTAIGLMQWFALRGYRTVNFWFVLSSTIGWLMFNLGGPVFGWVVAGFFTGIMQYLGITRYKGSACWILANPIIWPIAGWVGFIVGTAIFGTNPILAWVMGWAVVGMTGAILLLLPLNLWKEKTTSTT